MFHVSPSRLTTTCTQTNASSYRSTGSYDPHYEDYGFSAPPSPTPMNGAQTAGWAFAGSDLSRINASMARRSASARPISGCALSSAIAVVVSLTAALDFTGQ